MTGRPDSIAGVLVDGMLLLQRGGRRPMEILISVFVVAIDICYLAGMTIVPPDRELFA